MKKSVFQRLVCLMLSVVMLLGVFVTNAFAFDELVADPAHGSENGGHRPSLDEMKTYLDASSYAAYLDEYRKEDGTLPVPDVTVPGFTDGVYRVDVVDRLHDYGEGDATAEKSYGIVVKNSQICKESMLDDSSAWEYFGAGMDGESVYLSSESEAMWDLEVPSTGMYYVRITYFSCKTSESSISSIERQILINAALPFTEAGSLKLNKTWKYDYVTEHENLTVTSDDVQGVSTDYQRLKAGESYKGIKVEKDGYYKFVVTVSGTQKSAKVYQISGDINDNSMTPHMVQDPQWATYYCQDTTGFYNEYFSFYFQEGANSLTLKAQREPMIVSAIELVPIGSDADIPTYNDYYESNGLADKAAGKGNVTIQAEFPDAMSDSSVTIGSDNSSSQTFPAAPSSQLHNTIGKLSYNTVGQWAAYKLQVNETGMYKLSMRYKQNTLQGMYVCRALKLSGGIYGEEATVPFKEAYNTQFDYSDEWQSNYLGATNLVTGEAQVFEFYFEKGVEYTLYLECSLGSLKELIKDVEDAMEILNNSYLRILQLTGATPDENYDYRFQETLPMELIALAEQAKVLDRTARAFETLCGTKGAHIATLDTVALLLHNMSLRWGEEIASNMSNLKSYLGTLGTWINDSKRSAMIVDSITVHPVTDAQKQLPKAKAGFFGSMWFEIRSFFGSFFTDYDAMGLTEKPKEGSESVEVWIATGRDQSNIWRALIDSEKGFTNQTGKAVKLKLVTGGTLLPSILASKGPDIYIGLDSASIINYAIRDAIVGVSGNYKGGGSMEKSEVDALNKVFNTYYYTVNGVDYTEAELAQHGLKKEDATFVSIPYSEITSEEFGRYVPAAMDTITLLGVSYGIPSGMGFAMMFYRSDILAELGREIPKTWNELMGLLPDMQANNMSIGLSYGAAINFILYQRGGNMWLHTDNPNYAGARIGLNTDVAKASFSWVTRLYTEFGFDISFDASNRFRTGEMPIVISEYTSTYNTLTVYATELNGVWGFCSLPGWERPHPEDEGMIWIDYSSLCSISATVLLHGYEDALSSWQFMQWQTDEWTQSEYGNRMVALIGPSAKYESANKMALDGMSWTAEEKKAIWDQMDHLYSIVNYPGSYIIGRYTEFAFLAAVNDRQDPVEALMGYIDAINDEVYRKRAEFDMPLLETDELPTNA
ncbi:MAG: extracellular solute-binding protein [Clostridia bacterium]|nr:extracellular solute-binding protein [Clostridia bacterium]